MTTQTITLNLPDALYQSARKLANVTKRPIEEVVSDSLVHTLPPLDDVAADEAETLAWLSTFDDAALWEVADQKMTEAEQDEVATLLDKQEQQELIAQDKQRLNQLLDKSSHLMVEKAHAWLLLARRGYKVPVQTA